VVLRDALLKVVLVLRGGEDGEDHPMDTHYCCGVLVVVVQMKFYAMQAGDDGEGALQDQQTWMPLLKMLLLLTMMSHMLHCCRHDDDGDDPVEEVEEVSFYPF